MRSLSYHGNIFLCKRNMHQEKVQISIFIHSYNYSRSFGANFNSSKCTRRFTYVTALSPTLPSLYVCNSSFFNPSVASPTSQLILQPFFRFFYVKGFSLTSPGEPPMVFRMTEAKMSMRVVPIPGGRLLRHRDTKVGPTV